MPQLIGTAPNQVPTNGDLGSAAYMDTSAFYGIGLNPVFRNRIINGDMRIDQRNAGAAQTGLSSYMARPADMIRTGGGSLTTGRYSLQRVTNINGQTGYEADSAPINFTHSVKYTVTTSETESTGAAIFHSQFIEGYNIADFNFGTAFAKTFTVSFWVKSSVPGPYEITIHNSNSPVTSFVTIYNINVANTWEYKTVTIPGPTSSTPTWDKTNGAGLRLDFKLKADSAAANTTIRTGVWLAESEWTGRTTSNNLFATTNATWYITGLQVEAGTVATPFEYRSYQTELSLCLRYFQKSYPVNTAVATNSNAGYHTLSMGGIGSNYYQTGLRWKVSMRDTPAVTIYNPAGTSGVFYNTDTGSSVALSSITDISSEGIGFLYSTTSSNSAQRYAFHYIASAEF
jgi:hypothetical protein